MLWSTLGRRRKRLVEFEFLEPRVLARGSFFGVLKTWFAEDGQTMAPREVFLLKEGLVVEAGVAGFEDFGGGDALDHFGGAVVAEVELVVFFDVLEGVGFAAVGGCFLWVGWSQESDEGAFESDGHVEGGGVVGDDEFGACDEGHEEGDGG